MNIDLTLTGVMEIEKRWRDEDEPFEVAREKNTVVTTGNEHFLKTVGGIAGALELGTTSFLRIYNSSLVEQQTGLKNKLENTGTEMASTAGATITHLTPGTASASVRYEWVDDSSATYDVHTGRVYLPGNTVQFNSATFSSGGTKPTNQIWTYRLTITLSGSGAGSEWYSGGLDEMLRAFSGNNVSVFGVPEISVWATAPSATGSWPTGAFYTMGGVQHQGNSYLTSPQRLRWTYETGVGEGEGDWAAIGVTGQPDIVRLMWRSVSMPAQGQYNIRTLNVDFTL